MSATEPAPATPAQRSAPSPTFVPVPDIAEMLGRIVTQVHQLLRDRDLIAVRRDGKAVIPAEFIDGNDVLRGVTGTITLLTDAGYSDEEIIEWMFTPDDKGSPMELLQQGRMKLVHRRAQVTGF